MRNIWKKSKFIFLANLLNCTQRAVTGTWSCILCFSMSIDLSHKFKSYGHTSKKKKFELFQEAIWCSLISYIYRFAKTEVLWNVLVSSWKVFKGIFLMTNQFHSYNTRNSNTFYLFLARTNTRLFGIKFRGAKFFNSRNRNIQSAAIISLFESRLKTFLLSWLTTCK